MASTGGVYGLPDPGAGPGPATHPAGTPEEILEGVVGILRREVRIPVEGAGRATRLAEDLGLESMEIFMVFCDVEKAFRVTFGSDEIRTVTSTRGPGPPQAPLLPAATASPPGVGLLEFPLDGAGPWTRAARPWIRALLGLLAAISAARLFLVLRFRSPAVLSWLRTTRPGVAGSLRRIAFARWVRRASSRGLPPGLVFRAAVVEGDLRLLGSPCVYAILHSSWNRFFAPLLADLPDLRFLAAREWESAHGSRVARVGDPAAVLDLVRHLREGRQATAAMDATAGSCGVPVRLLGREVRVIPWAVDLARAGRVPVVPAVHRAEGSRIVLVLGEAVTVDPGPEGKDRAARAVVEALEGRIREDPSSWERVLSFLAG